jgi:hypothetical protein
LGPLIQTGVIVSRAIDGGARDQPPYSIAALDFFFVGNDVCMAIRYHDFKVWSSQLVAYSRELEELMEAFVVRLLRCVAESFVAGVAIGGLIILVRRIQIALGVTS